MGQQKILGFKFPFKRIEYPSNQKVEPYYQFLKENGQNPKDYVLDLFDKYDIVVLCENLHPEDTQWDFIYEVVSDKRFCEDVGNIFTEYGCVRDQEKVDNFMQTSYDSDTALQKATATLMNYHSGNFYFFMEKLYKLNLTLPDSLKINEYFTDPHGWNYLYSAYYDPINYDFNDPRLSRGKRDSLMAQVIIDWYNNEKKKCLVITNYRHAFIVNNNNILDNFAIHQAQCIYSMFPEKTANVMLYGSAPNGITLKPIHNGIWNRALKETGYTPVGFDLKDSPFGKDHFDKFPHFFKPYPYIYSDIFTGFVFYKPEEKFTFSKQPYKKYGAEEEYKFSMQYNLVDSIKAKRFLKSYTTNEGGQFDDLSSFSIYCSSYHFADILIWLIWALLVLLILIIRLPFQLLKTKNTEYIL